MICLGMRREKQSLSLPNPPRPIITITTHRHIDSRPSNRVARKGAQSCTSPSHSLCVCNTSIAVHQTGLQRRVHSPAPLPPTLSACVCVWCACLSLFLSLSLFPRITTDKNTSEPLANWELWSEFLGQKNIEGILMFVPST